MKGPNVLRIVAAALVAALAAMPANAQIYPDRPVKIVLPFGAGGVAEGTLKIGTVNIGGTQNLGAELLKSAAGIDVQIVPFRNSPEIVVGLLRNDVQMMVDFPAAVKGQFDDGKLRNGMTSLGNRPRVLIAAQKI